ncbi:MAG: hypothetical protein LQ339_000659 [Xanthoria mediterranea]|nr:MAG: hypothetical protein LQ339_000659 [Xanthoria mediterranea]
MSYLIVFIGLFLWRYLRLVANLCAVWTYGSIPLPATPSYSNADVTVVIPTLADGEDFRRCLLTIFACRPAAIIVVTPGKRIKYTIGTQKANKRLQMIEGLKAVGTAITVFADDDVIWAPTLLTYLLAPFEDHKIGAAGGLQTLERKLHPNCWDFLGAIYLERRKFELAATNTIDGGVGCLSGRTFAIRTGIIQNEQFCNGFREERWLASLPLVAADDDNFVTRYLVNHGWGIAVQLIKEAELTTTLENNPKFLAQCVRWRRTTWRSNFTSLFVDRLVWSDQSWTTYAVHLSSFNPPAVILDSLLGYTLCRAVRVPEPPPYIPSMPTSLVIFLVWIMFTKIIKFVGHFGRYPTDLKFVPVLYLFSYLHGFIYLYSLLTLNKKAIWSSWPIQCHNPATREPSDVDDGA